MLTKKYDYDAKYANNSSGIRGVSYDKTKKKWEAKVQQAGRRVRVGFFDNIKAAHDARAEFLAQSPGQHQQMEAARRLSKAAPDLLEALEALVFVATHHMTPEDEVRATIRKCREAIAKAKGE